MAIQKMILNRDSAVEAALEALRRFGASEHSHDSDNDLGSDNSTLNRVLNRP
jgi:hypothetical protein